MPAICVEYQIVFCGLDFDKCILVHTYLRRLNKLRAWSCCQMAADCVKDFFICFQKFLYGRSGKGRQSILSASAGHFVLSGYIAFSPVHPLSAEKEVYFSAHSSASIVIGLF